MLENYGYIYKITNNVNGKIYIGQKKSPVLIETYWGSGKLITQAIKKYGIENFSREILQWCSCKEELNQQEVYFISIFKSRDSNVGYNLSPGGTSINSGRHFSEEHKRKISEANKGRKASEKTRSKLSEVHKGLQAGEKHPLYGKHHSKETKKLMSEAHMGIKMSDETRKRMSIAKQNISVQLRESISARMKGNQIGRGRIWINNGKISKMVYPNEIPYYKELGFITGRIFPLRKNCEDQKE